MAIEYKTKKAAQVIVDALNKGYAPFHCPLSNAPCNKRCYTYVPAKVYKDHAQDSHFLISGIRCNNRMFGDNPDEYVGLSEVLTLGDVY
jgi:hypothetical protein